MIKSIVKLFRNLIDVDDLKEDIKKRVIAEVQDRVMGEVEEIVADRVIKRIQKR